MKQALDKGLNKIISRKLLSWITASTFLCLGFINNEQWTAITIGYVGIQGFADLAATWKHGKLGVDQKPLVYSPDRCSCFSGLF